MSTPIHLPKLSFKLNPDKLLILVEENATRLPFAINRNIQVDMKITPESTGGLTRRSFTLQDCFLVFYRKAIFKVTIPLKGGLKRVPP